MIFTHVIYNFVRRVSAKDTITHNTNKFHFLMNSVDVFAVCQLFFEESRTQSASERFFVHVFSRVSFQIIFLFTSKPEKMP